MLTHQLKVWINLTSELILYLLIILIPLFFWNQTTDYFVAPKLIILVLTTLLFLLFGALESLAEGHFNLRRTPLDLPLLLLLIIASVSTFFAEARFVAILGNFPDLHNGLVAMVTYILFYFTLINRLKSEDQVKRLLGLLTISMVAVAVISLLSYFGLFLPFSVAKSISFTPTGSAFSTTAILALLLPLPLLQILHHTNGSSAKISYEDISKWILTAVLTIFALTIALTGTLATYIGMALAISLTLLSTPPDRLKRYSPYLATPAVIVILVAAFSFIKMPLPNNFLYNQAQSFPDEQLLPLTTSWKVSISAFRDSPFWGSGPGSYLFDFSIYKPLEFNQTPFWNNRFDHAFNEYLGALATLGSGGAIALVLLTAIFLSLAFKELIWPQTTDAPIINRSLAISGIAFFTILGLHTSTLPFMTLGLIILASFMIVYRRVGTLRLDQTLSAIKEAPQLAESIPGILVMFSLVVASFVLYFTGRFALADYYHRRALNAAAKNDGLGAYNALVKAEELNGSVDIYHTDLAQTNFALANAIALSHAPTSASPSGSLSDNDKQNIQTLLSQAISEARSATTLSPNNPVNWEILASIYRQIAGVAENALVFALDSYGKAIQKDPHNPSLRLNAGSLYYSIQNYDLAIRLFSDSIALKSDYPNGYYNLAVALREKGDLDSALVAAEKAVSFLDSKSADYQVAVNLLNELRSKKDKEASAAATQSETGLENSKLPKVLDLPKPDKIATPPAVKK